jgi:hypothetical protein
MPLTRPYPAGRPALELDGVHAGFLSSAAGGDAVGEVVSEQLGADGVIRKHLAGIRYTDVVLQCGPGMGGAFFDWLSLTTSQKHQRRDGAVLETDFDGKERSRLAFTQALVTSIGFPALDAGSKDAAKLTVSLAPEQTHRTAGSGAPIEPETVAVQKTWLSANFRLAIDGLECKQVASVAPITITTALAEQAVGELRDYRREPAHLDVSDLVVTLAEPAAETWNAWFESFVIKGGDHEKTGTLECLAPDLKTVLFTLGFAGLGIYRLHRPGQQRGADSVARVTAFLYCEQVRFTAGAVKPGARRVGPLVDAARVRPDIRVGG